MQRRLSRAPLLAALVSAALVACACSSPKAVKWEKLEGEGFAAEMPGAPKKETHTVETEAGTLSFNTYTVESGGEVFIVGYNDFPEEMREVDPAELLENAKAGAVRNVNGRITGEREITIGGHPGREFVGDGVSPEGEGAQKRDGEATFTARIYWVSPRLYQVLHVRPKGNAPGDNARRFLDSFALK